MSKLLLPSQALAVLLERLTDLKDVPDDQIVQLDAGSAEGIYAALDQIRRQTALMEHELFAHRLAEAAEKGREMINALATDQFEALVVDPEGKVVRPDFRKGTRS
ncbi:MAG: hypothetical protein DI604_24605 [Delftia acidovorans]|nr:MAG: hypothetical protein DI604_24605 [Delftia acidovorans]